MLKFLKTKKMKTPEKTSAKSVSALRFNDMISYYTHELEQLRANVEKLKQDNQVIMNTAIKQGEKVRQLEEENKSIKSKLEKTNKK